MMREIYCLYIKKALESKDFKVNAFDDSYEALNELRVHHEKYFLVISDLRMPKVDGFQLVNEIKMIDPTLKVILMSAYCISESDIMGNLNPGVRIDKFITKPISLNKFIDIIQAIT